MTNDPKEMSMSVLYGPDGRVLGGEQVVQPQPAKREPKQPRVHRGWAGRALALAVPLLLVNGAAVWGQSGWAYDHVTEPGWMVWTRVLMAVTFAAAVESVGIYLAWEAHAALMADQAAGLLRLGSYGIGVLAGTLNYWHFAGTSLHPTAQAVTFATMSALSPWLWAIRSRSMNRGRLAELGLIDERGVKLSTNRKFWHPWKSLAVMSWASWAGETNPAAAVSGWEQERAQKLAADAEPEDTDGDMFEVPDTVADIDFDGVDLSGETAGDTAGTGRFDAADARRLARGLRAADPDMSVDMIAVAVGKSTKQVGRYLSDPEPVRINGTKPERG